MTTRIGWLDPSMYSSNLGDQIVSSAVKEELSSRLAEYEFVRLPTQKLMTIGQRRIAKSCSHFVVGGTNLLNSNVPQYIQWRLDPHLVSLIRSRTSLMGVGWWQYQGDPNWLARSLWRSILAKGAVGVRDEYTQNKLRSIGIKSYNTSCPTMWNLPEQLEWHAVNDVVVVTVTDYHQNQLRDRAFLASLSKHYEEVLLWPQGKGDLAYARDLNARVTVLPATLEGLDAALAGPVDYMGTRLHAGIRALQKGNRAAVIAVDNRAPEIARNTGLPVIERAVTPDMVAVFKTQKGLKLTLPNDAIEAWRHELRSLCRDAK